MYTYLPLCEGSCVQAASVQVRIYQSQIKRAYISTRSSSAAPSLTCDETKQASPRIAGSGLHARTGMACLVLERAPAPSHSVQRTRLLLAARLFLVPCSLSEQPVPAGYFGQSPRVLGSILFCFVEISAV